MVKRSGPSLQSYDMSIIRRKLAKLSKDSSARKHFSAFLFEELASNVAPAKRLFFWLLQQPVRALIWVTLRPRLEKPGSLGPKEVDRVYTRQARRYDRTHHFTTRGQDTVWRRWVSWQVASRDGDVVRVLDLCTGTGLTVSEMLHVAEETGTRLHVVGIDYNEAMLKVAKKRFDLHEKKSLKQYGSSIVEFYHADATALIGDEDACSRHFLPESFDIVSQIFGIGGIAQPLKVFDGVLQILREGGAYCLVDMHQPVSRLPGQWPFFGAWLETPGFETYTYLTTTIPLALARLWAWRDTTLDFYVAPLITSEDDGVKWGFKIVSRVIESERWWLGLPVMPTCKLVLEKIRISEAEWQTRRDLLSTLIT